MQISLLVDNNLLTAFGLLLLLGVIGGHAVSKLIKLPRISGYIGIGLLLGELVGNTFFAKVTPFIQLALALALFEVARRVDLHWICREKKLAWMALFSTLTAGSFLTFFLHLVGLSLPESLLLASIGMGSAPAIILSVIQENRAEGVITDRLLALTALGNLFGFGIFTLAHGWLQFSRNTDVEYWLLLPGLRLIAGVMLGLCIGWLAIRVARWMGAEQKLTRQTLLFSLVALMTGIAELAAIPIALPAAIFGLAMRNLNQGYSIVEPRPLTWTPILFLGLFVVTGMQIDLRLLLPYGLLAAAYLLLRYAAFSLVLLLGARSGALGGRRTLWLAMGLTPISSGALGLYALAGPVDGMPIASGVLLSAMALSGLFGPVLTKLALEKCGESEREIH